MRLQCPYCQNKPQPPDTSPKVIRFGRFRRKSDSRWIDRFRCKACLKSFSRATHHPCYGQNKRQVNHYLRQLLCSGVSQRRSARILKLNRKTVARKLCFLGTEAHLELGRVNQEATQVQVLEFDDMETFEHTKCKPLSITLAVEYKTRRVLGFEVSQMPAKGPLAKLSRKKYGPRADKRSEARQKLFKRIQPFVHPQALIKSDENPHYPKDVKKHFPKATHEKHKGRRGCIVGQGELKKIGFDPLFSLNHTCAKLRADICRLFRRTWCTTKRADQLALHITMYVVYHNEFLSF